MLNPSNEEPFDSSDRLNFGPAPAREPVGDAQKHRAEPIRRAGASTKGIVRIGKDRLRADGLVARPPAKTDHDPADAIYSEIAALKSSLQEAQNRAADESTDRRLKELSGQLDTIAKSVEFTEAYVTVGLTTRMAELIKQELSSAETYLARLARSRFRTVVASSIAIVFITLLGVEMTTDGVTSTVASLTSRVERLAPLQDDVGALLRGLRE